MAIFLTGSTGYIGAHVAANLLEQHGASLNLLVRARDPQEAQCACGTPCSCIWISALLRIPADADPDFLRRPDFARLWPEPRRIRPPDPHHRFGDSLRGVAEPQVGKELPERESARHARSAQLARQAEHYHGLRRFSQVSTVAVAGKRSNEVVTEDHSIEWDRSDYDPYARTKKFCEHMTRVLLPDTPKTIFRPSIVLGDSRHAETTQFDMVKAFVFLAGLPVLPFRPD